MKTLNETRKCTFCQNDLQGRSDKKFCDDYCRNSHNNRLNSAHNNLVRNINHRLLKNRRILERMIPDGEEMTRVAQSRLLGHGFHFNYHTNLYTNKRGQVYQFCYDYGYLPVDNENYLVVRQRMRH